VDQSIWEGEMGLWEGLVSGCQFWFGGKRRPVWEQNSGGKEGVLCQLVIGEWIGVGALAVEFLLWELGCAGAGVRCAIGFPLLAFGWDGGGHGLGGGCCYEGACAAGHVGVLIEW